MFNPEEYSVTIKREKIEGEFYYVARIKELPDATEYGDSYQEAHELAISIIRALKESANQAGRFFPEPIKNKEMKCFTNNHQLV